MVIDLFRIDDRPEPEAPRRSPSAAEVRGPSDAVPTGRWHAGSLSRVRSIVVALAATLALAACSESGATTDGDHGSSGDDSAVVEEAKELSSFLDEGFVFSPTNNPSSPAEIERYGTWRGPTSGPTPVEHAKVQVILVTKQSDAAVQFGDAVVKAGNVLGWTVEVIDGQGTTQGFAQAFDTALGRSPQAIISMAIPAQVVSDKLAEAREKGIVTIGAGLPETAEPTYDTVIDLRMPLAEALLAYRHLADTDGRANTIVVQDPAYPQLVTAMDQYVAVMETCSGCKTTETTWQLTDTGDPSKVNAIISGALSRNPDATALTVPYSAGLPAVVAAVRSAGKAEQVAILAKDADAVGLTAVMDGESKYNAGTSFAWVGWAAMDQVVRGLAGDPYLTQEEVGLGVVLLSESTVPESAAVDDHPGIPDYAAEYTKVWTGQ